MRPAAGLSLGFRPRSVKVKVAQGRFHSKRHYRFCAYGHCNCDGEKPDLIYRFAIVTCVTKGKQERSEGPTMHQPFDIPESTNVVSPSRASIISNSEVQGRHHKRRISPQAGRALEILGHAIGYLTDELVYEGGPLSAHNGQLEAIGLLMARNRTIYFSCPVIPSLGEQLRTFFRIHFRWLMFAGGVPHKR